MSTTQASKLTARGGLGLDVLGQSVSVSADGSFLAAGAPGVTAGADLGAAYVFGPLASPSLAVTPPAAGIAGSAITPVSWSISGGISPTGTVTFTVFGPQSAPPTDCTTGGTTVGTATAAGNGTRTLSATFTPSAAGDYWWFASYGGDAGNNPAASLCGQSMPETVVTAASSSLSATAPPAGTAGVAIADSSLSASLSGGSAPTGTITFEVFGPQPAPPSDCTTGGTTVGTVTVSGDGTYMPSAGFTPSAAGDYWWFASYAGDANNNPADSGCSAAMPETVVAAASPSLSATGPGSGSVGSAIAGSSISAALSGGSAPTRTIMFKVFGPQAEPPSDCTTGGTTVGTAAVSGDGTYMPSAGFTPSAAGDYWWFATYGGDAGNNPAASACGASMAETVVAAANTSLSASAPLSGAAGSAIAGSSISSVLSGGSAPTGTITFTVFGPQPTPPSDCTTGGTTVGIATVSGNGPYTPSADFTPPRSGDYWWVASYGGDANNNPSTSACGGSMAKTVVTAAKTSTKLSASINPSRLGEPVTFTATVAGTRPSGTVNFKSDDESIVGCGARPLSASGTAACTTSSLAPGADSITALYGGDSVNAGSTSAALTQTVEGGSSTPTQPGQQGQPGQAPDNHFTVSHIRTHHDGTLTFAVKVPGPGRIDVLETSANNNLARTAIVLRPAARRFVFARAQETAEHVGTLRLRVRPNRRGRRLVHHHTHRVTLSLVVAYTPTGGRFRKQGFNGLHLPKNNH